MSGQTPCVNEDVELLKRAGCLEVQLGIESADPRILRNMNKGADPAIYHDALTKLRSAGINCSCYFIFGFPGETEESAGQTRAFIKTHDRMDIKGGLAVSLFPFILSPLSPIYAPEARKPYALSGYMKRWAHQTMDYQGALRETPPHLYGNGEYRGHLPGRRSGHARPARPRKSHGFSRHPAQIGQSRHGGVAGTVTGDDGIYQGPPCRLAGSTDGKDRGGVTSHRRGIHARRLVGAAKRG